MKKILIIIALIVVMLAAEGLYKKSSREKDVVGIIVPHHDVAENMTREVFSIVDENKFDTIVIIGPNHFLKGDLEKAYTTKEHIEGIEVDVDISMNVEVKDEIFIIEHSIREVVKHIIENFENKKIVPIVLGPKMDINDCKVLAEKLHALAMKKRVLIVASIDFSHYLDKETAYEKDKQTMEVIKQKDYEKIYSLGNDNLDSSETLITFLTLMDMLGVEDGELLRNSNSADEGNYDPSYTTSYMTWLYRK